MKQIWKNRYQIIEKLGQGGTGQVYQVWDLHLEKEWAMKILEADCREEVQILKKLSNSYFPRIVDVFEEDEKYVLVMDCIHGITLEEMLRKGALKEEKVIQIGKQIAEAVSYLHQYQPVLLYLDLKPANIMLQEDGTVKLIDFGSVKVKGKGKDISGTFGFASPEQIKLQKEGRNLKEQSDIFSFGMVLFSMITGKMDKLPLMEEGRKTGFYVRTYNPFISGKLEQIVEKCTRGNPEKRYTSMRDIRQALESWEKKYLGKRKKGGFIRKRRFCLWDREEWHQEKSILYTQGKASLYIAGRMLSIFLSMLFVWQSSSYFVSEMFVFAKEKERFIEQIKQEELEVILRDSKMRKVLVKKGCAYETKESVLLEIPWEEVGSNMCEITVICEVEEGIQRDFQISCKKIDESLE